MIIVVAKDIKVFMLFFVIMLVFFSMVFNIISRNNSDEYRELDYFWANFINVFRLSLGDFQFNLLDENDDPKLSLNKKQHILFWILWLAMLVFTSMIFLNFIIAEVCNSYVTINDNIDAIIYKERAGLIWKAEEITSKKYKEKNKVSFPKYIVVRELEDK